VKPAGDGDIGRNFAEDKPERMMAKGQTGDSELLPRVPPDRAEHYRQQGWWQQERVDELVLRHSIALAGKSAVVAGDRGLTYGELANRGPPGDRSTAAARPRAERQTWSYSFLTTWNWSSWFSR